MPVHIGSLETEVSVEPAQSAPPESARQAMEWEERMRIASHHAQLLREELRTRARAYDD